MGMLRKLFGVDVAEDVVSSMARSPINTARLVRDLARRDRNDFRVAEGVDGRERYENAMRHFQMTDDKVGRAITNTCRSFYFYSGIFFLIAVYAIAGNHWTAAGPAAVAAGLALRSSVTNWMLRRCSADGFPAYIKGGDYLPRKMRP
jgi:hypothetical protein